MDEKYELTEVAVEGLPWTSILEAESVDKLLLSPGRHLLGAPRQEIAYQTSITWLKAMRNSGFFPANPNDICTVTVLAEGIGHNLSGALSVALDGADHRGDNWIGASRFSLEKVNKDEYTPFDAKVTYMRLHSVAPVWCLLDTVATGATLVRALEAAFNSATKPKTILMGTPAGTATGMRKIASLCTKEGIDLKITFYGAIFGLGEDGTALPWCHPQTILSGTAHSKTNAALAEKLFNKIPDFCAVGDCSANFFDVKDAKQVLAEEEKRLGWKIPLAQAAK